MRRLAPRLNLEHYANLYLDQIPYTARIDNLSSQGVAVSRLSGPHRLNFDEAELELILPHRDELVRIQLDVAWTDTSRRLGGRFSSLVRRYRITLERFLSESCSSHRNILKANRALCQYQSSAVHLGSD